MNVPISKKQVLISQLTWFMPAEQTMEDVKTNVARPLLWTFPHEFMQLEFWNIRFFMNRMRQVATQEDWKRDVWLHYGWARKSRFGHYKGFQTFQARFWEAATISCAGTMNISDPGRASSYIYELFTSHKPQARFAIICRRWKRAHARVCRKVLTLKKDGRRDVSRTAQEVRLSLKKRFEKNSVSPLKTSTNCCVWADWQALGTRQRYGTHD